MRTVDKQSIEIGQMEERQVIPGVPQTVEAAVAAIDETEHSVDEDWLPLDAVLDEISLRYRSYAN